MDQLTKTLNRKKSSCCLFLLLIPLCFIQAKSPTWGKSHNSVISEFTLCMNSEAPLKIEADESFRFTAERGGSDLKTFRVNRSSGSFDREITESGAGPAPHVVSDPHNEVDGDIEFYTTFVHNGELSGSYTLKVTDMKKQAVKYQNYLAPMTGLALSLLSQVLQKYPVMHLWIKQVFMRISVHGFRNECLRVSRHERWY